MRTQFIATWGGVNMSRNTLVNLDWNLDWMVNAAIIDEVFRILAKRERWIAEYEAARKAAANDTAREAVESAERVRRAAELRIRDARRAETYRAILHPDSGASQSERQQAQSHLSNWSNT